MWYSPKCPPLLFHIWGFGIAWWCRTCNLLLIAISPEKNQNSYRSLQHPSVSWLCKSHELNNHTAEIPLKNHFPAEAPEKNIMCSAETSKKHHVSCLNSH